MMGRQTGDQSQLFYLFNLEELIPASHLLRRINPVVTRVLAELRENLTPFYSDIGRPSIDPELEGIEFVIRAVQAGMNEWVVTIHFPDASEPLARSSEVKVTGTRDEAIALAA
jgi:hypothetical protein